MYNLIKEELKKQGRTFYWLFKETGIAEQVFSNMHKRKTNLSVENALKVAKALGITVEELIKAGMKEGV